MDIGKKIVNGVIWFWVWVFIVGCAAFGFSLIVHVLKLFIYGAHLCLI